MEDPRLLDEAEMPFAASLLAPRKSNNCMAVTLPQGGVITLPDGNSITLSKPALFRPSCVPANQPAIIANGGGGTHAPATGDQGITFDEASDQINPQLSDLSDPFYASVFPQCYALAATTVVAYTLVIMLFITPRSFLDGGVVVLGRRGFTSGGAGGPSIGGRPWLQKVAALTVAISLTIATADTFRAAEDQYMNDYQNAAKLQSEVLGGTELKVIRIVSDTFLWLAQAQTLIRLFPRQREKIIIKWAAFALITLDLIFQTLDSFLYADSVPNRPKTFTDAIPALSYLFQLSLGVLYAAWVIYYSLMKKRYSYYHPQMKNMILVAMLSVMALLIPVVFFILDMAQPDFTGWGDYVRWVGAAAASVIVWEWVERIEALEREEKKDGILGREVFDGDEMMEITPSDFTWPRRRRPKKGSDDGSSGGELGNRPNENGLSSGRGPTWPSMASLASRYRSRSNQRSAEQPAQPPPADGEDPGTDRIRFLQPPLWPARPAPAVTPVSRADTASAASTVYAVRYHPLTETTARTTPPPAPQVRPSLSRSNSTASTIPGPEEPSAAPQDAARSSAEQDTQTTRRWRGLAPSISLPRIGRRPSTEEDGRSARPGSPQRDDDGSRWDIRSRLEEFAVTQAEKLRERIRPTPDTDSLPVRIIPAPQRRGAALAQLLEEEEEEGREAPQSPGASHAQTSTAQSSRQPLSEEPSPTLVPTLTGASSESMSRPGLMPPRSSFGARGRPPPPALTIVPAPPREPRRQPAEQPSQISLGKQVVEDLGRSRSPA